MATPKPRPWEPGTKARRPERGTETTPRSQPSVARKRKQRRGLTAVPTCLTSSLTHDPLILPFDGIARVLQRRRDQARRRRRDQGRRAEGAHRAASAGRQEPGDAFQDVEAA